MTIMTSFLFETFGKELLERAKRYPRLYKTVTLFLAFITAVSALVHSKQVLQTSVNKWLPSTQISLDDELSACLSRWVQNKWKPFRRLATKAESVNYRRMTTRDPEFTGRMSKTFSKDIHFDKAGTQFFWHKRTLFSLHPEKGDKDTRTLTLRAVALSHTPIKNLLREVFDEENKHKKSGTVDILHSKQGRWRLLSRKERPLHTVDLDEEVKDALVRDAEWYLDEQCKARYVDRGIPYRRGYLFYGPPGTGKSSMAMALAAYFQIPIYTLSLASPSLDDEMLAELLTRLPERGVLLLEDVDSAGLNREVSFEAVSRTKKSFSKGNGHRSKSGEDSEALKQHGLTLTGILNALDGAAASEGNITILSTNAPENLDPALVRAARVDRKILFDNASKEVAKKVFKRIVGDQEGVDIDAKAEEFAIHIPDRELSPAQIQVFLLDHMSDADGAISSVNEFVRSIRKEKGKTAEAPSTAQAGSQIRVSASTADLGAGGVSLTKSRTSANMSDSGSKTTYSDISVDSQV